MGWVRRLRRYDGTSECRGRRAILDARVFHRCSTLGTPGALSALERHNWPGNVRELQNVVARAIALSDRRQLTRDDIGEAITAGAIPPFGASAFTPLASQEHSIERRRLVQVLAAHGWDKACAAAEMGVHPVTLYRRMHRLGIPMRAAQHEMGQGSGAICADLQSFGAKLRNGAVGPEAQTIS